jgi:hypothetical protein
MVVIMTTMETYAMTLSPQVNDWLQLLVGHYSRKLWRYTHFFHVKALENDGLPKGLISREGDA